MTVTSLVEERYISLTTYKRDGTPVAARQGQGLAHAGNGTIR
jgi:hypothetical protein